MRKKRKDSFTADKGFTLLEVMIAIGIFSILILSIASMMRAEIRLFNNENHQNQNEQKARTAMSHVLDQVRLNGYVSFVGNGGHDNGLYSFDPEGTKCLLNLNPEQENQAEAEMFYLPEKDELWYNDKTKEKTYLLLEHITTLEIQHVTAHLIRIRVVAGQPESDQAFEIVTWARLY